MSLKKITSLANPEIKKIRSYAQKKYREEDGVFMTEGLRHALEAMEAGWEFKMLAVEEGDAQNDKVGKLIAYCEKQRALCLEVTPKIMESITRRDNAQSVVAVLKQRWVDLSEVAAGKEDLWVALEEIRDPGNLGTIMRTADAVGAKGIALIGNTCDPWSVEAIRASMGSFPQVKIVKCGRDPFIAHVQKAGCQVVGTHLKGAADFRSVKYKRPLVLVMGNEQAGMTDGLVSACSDLVKIPMRGKADSLNVSVATAVMLYEITKTELSC